MNLDINLAKEPTQKKELSRALFLSILFLIVAVVIVVGGGVYSLLLTSQVKSLSAESVELEEKIQRELARQDNYVVYVNKLSAITQLIESRIPLDARLGSLFKEIPGSINITQIDMTPESIRLLLSSSDLQSMNVFLQEGISKLSDADLDIEKVDVVSFERDGQNGQYNASILITYK